MNKVKVFLLDDHKIIRDGLRSILALNSNYVVVGEESCPRVFIENIQDLDFNVIILDLSFPGASGLELIPKIRVLRPNCHIVVLSMHNNPEFMLKSLKAGANCYLAKDIDSSELIKSLDEVLKGKVYVSSTMNYTAEEVVHKQMENPLSQRELEVLKLIATGLSSRQIAGSLKISSRTVETHRLHIMKKLKTSNSAETISVALKLSLF